jgi:hypothetical protein
MVIDESGQLLDIIQAEELNHTFAQGFYFGSMQEKKQHLWYLLIGLVMGFASGAAGMYWML